MKKFLSVFMAVIIAFGTAPFAYAQEGSSDQDRGAQTETASSTASHTMTQTVLNSGSPTSTVGSTINIGDTFDVVFDRSALNWSAGEFTSYSFIGFDNSWVKVGSSTTDIPVTIESITKSTETGAVTVRLKANTAYSGTLKVYLDSGTTTTLATTAFSKQLTIQDPKAIAEAEEKARIEAEEKAHAESEAAARAKAEEDNRKAESEAAARTRAALQTQQASEQESSSQPPEQSSSSSAPESSSQPPEQSSSSPQASTPEVSSQPPEQSSSSSQASPRKVHLSRRRSLSPPVTIPSQRPSMAVAPWRGAYDL